MAPAEVAVVHTCVIYKGFTGERTIKIILDNWAAEPALYITQAGDTGEPSPRRVPPLV